jgi:beta-lactam-binding protein with PASTA domain/tRNA A-37 threonylcarbamoyl transferase component Bud32
MPGSAVSDLAGRVLAGRYMLQNAIGTGASGRVYVAEDTRLRRRVAVKVLHAALAEDAAFLRRFRAEAQLAASLQHPHIVTVHDWGEDEVPFMVLELLEGGSLRAMLDSDDLLTVAQAARVGRDVASALDYAHSRGILHRDIKPANLLFDEHGIVRVADFGLARALAEASWTEPSGAVFGTARYASPEQATGVQLDARSDLYSLGLCMVEAVTGRIPFAADTTLGTLTARTQRPLVGPDELGPLAPVIDRVGAIDPAQRYPDAATMRAAISDAADTLPPPGPLVLAGMVDRADPNPTRAVQDRASGPPLFDQDAPDIVVLPDPAPMVESESAKERLKRTGQKRLVPLIVALVVLLTVVAAGFAVAQVRDVEPIQIPPFVGMNEAQARALARTEGVALTVERRQAADPKGVIFDQNPDPGSFSSDTDVKIFVSTGPPQIAVPAILNQPWPDAEKTLVAAGLLYNPPTARFDAKAPKNVVVQVVPNQGTSVDPDRKLDIVLSKGPAPVKIPDVSDMPFEEARTTLTDLKFKVKRGDDVFSGSIDEGNVVSTAPGIGTAAPFQSEVTVQVSKGPDLVTVPNLANLRSDEASEALEERGLEMDVEGSFRRNDRITGQDPAPGDQIERGSTVTVTFDKQDCILFICFD